MVRFSKVCSGYHDKKTIKHKTRFNNKGNYDMQKNNIGCLPVVDNGSLVGYH